MKIVYLTYRITHRVIPKQGSSAPAHPCGGTGNFIIPQSAIPLHILPKNGQSNRMKILFMTDRLDSGGAETHLETLALGLAERGHTVAVLSAGGRIADRLEASGIRQLRVPFPGRNPFRLLALLRFLRRTVRREGFDILHAHTRTMGVLLSCLPGRFGAHLVTVHAAKFGPLTRRMCRGAAVIAVSEDLRTGLLASHAAPAEVIRVIPNGVDVARFSPPSQPPPPHAVLFASRLDPDCSRAAELLLACVPGLLVHVPDLTVTLAGGGSMADELARRADAVNQRAGRAVVTLSGTVPDMAVLYRTHRVAVGVSRVALEAAACGCAVLLAGNEGYGGILDPSDRTPALSNFCCRGEGRLTEATFASDLARLLTDRQQPSPALRDWMVRDFSGAAMTAETERVCRSLLPPQTDAPPLRVLVGGYAGCGNLGDDAILQGLIAHLRTERPDIRLSALTGSPVRDRVRFGIPCYDRRWLPSVLSAMLRADVFLLGGGSLLQDGTSRRSLTYYLSLLRLARFLRCRTATLALGLGPLRSPSSERAVVRSLERCVLVTLRDAASLRFLVLHGMERSRLSPVPDPAVFLPPPPPLRRLAILARLGIPAEAKLLCVAVRPAGGSADALRVLASAVRRVVGTFGLTVVFPVLDRSRDTAVTESVIRLSGCGGRIFFPDEAADLPALFRSAELLVSMRLHALLFADSVGTPAIAVSPDAREGKISEFARVAGFPHFSAPSLAIVPLAATMESLLSGGK